MHPWPFPSISTGLSFHSPFLFHAPPIPHRVFKLKLDAIIKDIIKDHVLGRPVGYMYVVEYQKRGLPHAHILMILNSDDKPRNPRDYDKLICAELPDPVLEPDLFKTVTTCMMHGPCGIDNPTCPCMKDGYCSKHYPKDFLDETRESDGYPEYRRRDDGRTFEKAVPGRTDPVILDNRNVVPYNKALCKKYNVRRVWTLWAL